MTFWVQQSGNDLTNMSTKWKYLIELRISLAYLLHIM